MSYKQYIIKAKQNAEDVKERNERIHTPSKTQSTLYAFSWYLLGLALLNRADFVGTGLTKWITKYEK